MKNSLDYDSVYQQIKKEGKIQEEELFHDLIALTTGGFDTSARTATGTLYNLILNPLELYKFVNYLRAELSYNPKEKSLLPTLLTELT